MRAEGLFVVSVSMGLRDALQGPVERPPIVRDVDVDPVREHEPISLYLEPRPRDSWAVVRPWLLRRSGRCGR